MAVKEEILEYLNRGPSTATELAEKFNVTRNAIIVQLNQLEASGLISRSKPKSTGQVGKPAAVFEAVAGSEDTNSKAYKPFAVFITRAIVEQLSTGARADLYRDIANSMVTQVEVVTDAPLATRLAVATALVDELGAATQVEEQDDAYIVRSHTCPIAAVVRTDTHACEIVRAFFAGVTGNNVTTQCTYENKLLCKYSVAR